MKLQVLQKQSICSQFPSESSWIPKFKLTLLLRSVNFSLLQLPLTSAFRQCDLSCSAISRSVFNSLFLTFRDNLPVPCSTVKGPSFLFSLSLSYTIFSFLLCFFFLLFLYISPSYTWRYLHVTEPSYLRPHPGNILSSSLPLPSNLLPYWLALRYFTTNHPPHQWLRI